MLLFAKHCEMIECKHSVDTLTMTVVICFFILKDYSDGNVCLLLVRQIIKLRLLGMSLNLSKFGHKINYWANFI